MSKNTTPSAAATEALEALTAKGRETMLAIATGQTSFFDEGLVEGSGIWGGILTDELGHRSSGVINRLKTLGLFSHNPDDPADGVDAGGWWSLTELGAEVARTLQAEAELAKAEEAPKAPAKAKAKKAPAKAEEKSTPTPADEVRAMAGYRVHTKSRSTKTTAVLVDGEAAELDTDGGRWQLICLDHNFIVADSSQRHARDVLAHPEEWCGPCGKAFRKAAKTA